MQLLYIKYLLDFLYVISYDAPKEKNMTEYSNDYLLDRRVKIFQPLNGYRASTDAILLSSLVSDVKPEDKILDVGSGTGAISLCLAARFQHLHPQITGLELQKELAQLSNQSATANGFDKFLHYLHQDISQPIKHIANCSFQHVISNPPYTDHDMPSPNLSKALAHNHHGLDLCAWIRFCIKMLAPKGKIYLINRAEAVNEILAALSPQIGAIRLIPLYSKAGQNAKRIMIIGIKDSKAPTTILPPLTVHLPDGSYSSKTQQILREGTGFFETEH